MDSVFVALNLTKTSAMWTIENNLRNIMDVDVMIKLGVPLNYTMTAAESRLEITQVQILFDTPPFSKTPVGYRCPTDPLL
jgi:hypothetical protein